MRLPAFIPCSEEAQPRAYDFAVMTFHHLREAERVVQEVYRVLRPGSAFVIADVDRGHWIRSAVSSSGW